MPTFLTVLGLIFVLMSMTTTSIDLAINRMNKAGDTITLEQMAVYQRWVETYAQPRPSTSGTIADSTLGVPAWFARTPGINNYIAGGTGYVWFNPGTQALASRTASRAQGGVIAGVKIAGRLAVPGSSTLGPVLPAAIPEGATVVMR